MATVSKAFAIAIAHHQAGRPAQAEQIYRRILRVEPSHAEVAHYLGFALQNQGKLEDAAGYYRRALQLKPDFVEAHNNLGLVLRGLGRLDEAAACQRRVLQLKPDLAAAHNNLGNTLKELGSLDEAAACFRQAVTLDPSLAVAHCNLGSVFKDQGNLEQALAAYRRAMELKPDFAGTHSNLLYTQIFCPGCDARTIYQEHRRWDQRHAAPLATLIQPHANERSPQRRLRVGYVSPNFRRHAESYFTMPLFSAHDHAQFEIFCYSDVACPDDVTSQLRGCADVWRNVVGVHDADLAHLVRQDRIDILVDLNMHMAGCRLLAFARKPAPVQVTYLGYCGTTGLSTMDYRLTDPYLDPPGSETPAETRVAQGETRVAQGSEPIYSEESIRLPETYWCYRPAAQTPAVNSLPALEAGRITFGSLNNFCKVSPPALAAWVRLLQAIPESTLLLHAREGSHRQRLRTVLTQQGISAERLDFVDLLPAAEYFSVYQRIDVALDPFPYAGGTTTCDALWMGVPVVSLAGQTAVGRGGLSILSNLGLPELVARDTDEYVRIAAELAGDLPRLAHLRSSLRERMQGSSLMDAPRFAGHVETAYRQMWQRWCEGEREG